MSRFNSNENLSDYITSRLIKSDIADASTPDQIIRKLELNKMLNKSIIYNLLKLYFYIFLLVYFIINDKYADHQSLLALHSTQLVYGRRKKLHLTLNRKSLLIFGDY